MRMSPWRRSVLATAVGAWLTLGINHGDDSIGMPSAMALTSLLAPTVRVQLAWNKEGARQDIWRELVDHVHDNDNEKEEAVMECEWDAEEEWQVAERLFGGWREKKASSLCLAVPAMKRPEALERLATVLSSFSNQPFVVVKCELHPDAPAPYIQIKTLDSTTHQNDADVLPILLPQEETVKENMAQWVDGFLGRNRLCPYTSSMRASAVGLTSVGVSTGSVGLRVSYCLMKEEEEGFLLLDAVWTCIRELMETPESELATILLSVPAYDDDWNAFSHVCDSIIEPTLEAMGITQTCIGRAWFHPLYNTTSVGHDTVLPGHAIPHAMVHDFVSSSSSSSTNMEASNVLTLDQVSKANDLVRQTPHATINLLRRSQLNAAAEYEASLDTNDRPPPNSVYVRNVRQLTPPPPPQPQLPDNSL
eukprot:scaffold109541_cov50-Attheya_sp.AAC.1